MSWHRTLSGKILILLTLVFAFTTFDKISAVTSGDKPCLCAHDGYGYYAYLPRIYETGDLKFDQEWMQRRQDQYCFGAYAYQLEKRDLKGEINIYHMGLSFVLLPSYAISDVVARVGGYPTDGFSMPYHVGYQLNALLFIFLGLFYLRKLLRCFASEVATMITLILVALGANTYFIFNYQYDLPHLYLFTINAASFYHLIQYTCEKRMRSFWFFALLFGLAVCIRPTQLIFGIIPFLLLLKEFGKTKNFVRHMLLIGAAILFCNIPQILYWKIVGGDWIILNLHTEDIVLSDPNLSDFLFSYRKGWLLYSPLFLITPIGFWLMYRKRRTLFWATLSFTVLYIYVMSAWECWWYAHSFGQRVMVDIYPILAIPLVFVIDALKTRVKQITAGLFFLVCVVLNLFQSAQVQLGIIPGDRMTEEHYWLVFGELNPSEIHHRYLLINRGDLNWPKQLSKHDDLPFTIRSRRIYSRVDSITVPANGAISLGKIHLKKTFETDETLVEVPLIFSTSDSTQSAVLRMECISKYNCYSWDNIELSLGRRLGMDNYDTLRFNLPDFRHDADSMQIYIMNMGTAQVGLKEFTIDATSIFRK
ncbi:MAG: glycosyltransferase family 39 protein [bacterium]|nr:glycosyltransferase family 39 protein [bacterium]